VLIIALGKYALFLVLKVFRDFCLDEGSQDKNTRDISCVGFVFSARDVLRCMARYLREASTFI